MTKRQLKLGLVTTGVGGPGYGGTAGGGGPTGALAPGGGPLSGVAPSTGRPRRPLRPSHEDGAPVASSGVTPT